MVRTPRWFQDALSRHRSYIAERGVAQEDASRDLAELIIRDEEFVRAIVGEYVDRKLAAKRPHAKRGPWRDKTKRMNRAAELRSSGLPLRKIAALLVVSVGTIHADLTRWDAAHENVAALPFKSGVHHAQATSTEPDVMNAGTEHRAGATVRALRRTQ